MFVDESKHHGFLLAAAIVGSGDLIAPRKQVRALQFPRQRRIHFTTESPSRRRYILKRLSASPVDVIGYDVRGQRNVKEARDIAVGRLVDDITRLGAALLVIERDDRRLPRTGPSSGVELSARAASTR